MALDNRFCGKKVLSFPDGVKIWSYKLLYVLLQMYPGAYHQIHNEPNGQGEEAVSDIVKWITDMMSS